MTDMILFLISTIALTTCLMALEIVRHGHKPRNGEVKKLRELDEKIKKHV